MKYKTKKILTISSVVLIPTAILGIGFGVYFGTSLPERVSTKGIFTLRVNETLNNEGYKYDYSATYGSPLESNRWSILLNNEILHLKSEGKLEYDQKNKKVISPSYEYLSFSNADALVLTFVKNDVSKSEYESEKFFENNKNSDKYFQLIFNSDDAEITPSNDDNSFIVKKISNNKRSINSEAFNKIINSGHLASKPDLDNENEQIDTSNSNYIMTSLGITVDLTKDQKNKWVDSNGNKTKYDICVEDMYYSLMRTKLFDEKYRHENGGSRKIDDYFVDKTSTTKYFAANQKFPNEYLFDFLGIDKNKLYDRKTAIQDVYLNDKKSKAFTFNFNVWNQNNLNQNFSYSINEIIDKYISNSLSLSLAPSQYIDELAKDNSINNTSAGQIKDQAREFGIYTYAQKRIDTLYSSYYIPTKAQGTREVFEYNKYHPDQDWVESVEKGQIIDGKRVKTINKIIVEYTNGIDSSTFINQSFTSFLNGSISKMDYSLLSDAQKQKLYGTSNNVDQLIKNSMNNGLQPTKKINISSLTSRMVWQANPINNMNYSFNNDYSKLLYGYTSNELNKGAAVTTNSYYAGFGFLFRTLVQASINWNEYIAQAYKGTRDVWLSGAAQNAKFTTSDQTGKTPADYFESGVNDLSYLSYDAKTKEWVQDDVTLKQMIRLSSMTADEIKQEYPGVGDNIQRRKLQSPNFETIKSSMKKLLDDFYNENKGLSGNIEFQIAYPFADQDQDKCNATEALVQNVINQLDPRIKASFLKPTTREEMLTAVNQKRGAFNANLWTYDYEGIGSYLSAFVSDGGGTNMINAIGMFAKKQSDPDSYFKEITINDKNNTTITVSRVDKKTLDKLQKMFPRFTELSSYVRTRIDQILENEWHISDEKHKVENWDLISNYENNRILSYFDNNNIVVELSKIFKEFETESSWEKDTTLDSEQKGKIWTDLIKELNSIKGVSIDTESSCDKLENVNYTLFLKEYLIPLSRSGIQFFQDIKYEVKE